MFEKPFYFITSDPSGGHCIRMRGLPYSASERDIFDFFSPLVPFRVTLEKDTYGRASGEGEVEFVTHDDAVNGMKKDRGHIGKRERESEVVYCILYTFTFYCLLFSFFLGSRYIELFLHSSPSTSGSVAQYSYAYPAYAVSVYVIMYMCLLSC